MASHGEQTLALTTSTDKMCKLANDIGVGDCVQLAGSYIYLFHSLELEPDLALAAWSTTTYSSHVQTWYHDTWHQSFTFLTDDGQIAALVGTWDGPQMNDDNKRYKVRRTGTVNINPDLWDRITQVRWTYEC